MYPRSFGWKEPNMQRYSGSKRCVVVQHRPLPSLWSGAVLPFVDWSDITAVPGLMLSCFPGICSHCTPTCVPRSGTHVIVFPGLCFHAFSSSSFSEKVALKVAYFLNFLNFLTPHVWCFTLYSIWSIIWLVIEFDPIIFLQNTEGTSPFLVLLMKSLIQ